MGADVNPWLLEHAEVWEPVDMEIKSRRMLAIHQIPRPSSYKWVKYASKSQY